LHRETHNHPMLPQQMDSPGDLVCSLWIRAHGRTVLETFISTPG
jgi:hypothetical protein